MSLRCALRIAMLVVIALPATPENATAQQWIAPRISQSGALNESPQRQPINDPWIQPAAAYQPEGRAYAVNDPFPGQSPWGAQAVAPATVPPQGQVLPPAQYSGQGYAAQPYAGQSLNSSSGIVQPPLDGSQYCQPQYCVPETCQPGVYYQGGCAPPPDPYAMYTQPMAAAPLASAGFRRAYAELEGRMGDIPNSLHGNIFVPFCQQPDAFWFADIRGQWDDVDAREMNLGIAHRRLSGDVIYGIYGFYDLRETQFDNEFSGATVGIEALTLDWEGRLNWYIPEGGAQATGANAAVIVNDGIFVQQGVERAYYGFDGEIGMLLWRSGGQFDCEYRGFIGGYYFNNSAEGFDSFGGPRARLEARLYDLPRLGPGSRITFGGTVQYDEVRDTQGIASINLRIPFGRGGVGPATKLTPMERRMVSPIRRDDDIIVRTGLSAQEQAVLVGNGKDGVVATDITRVKSGDDLVDAVANGSKIVVVEGPVNVSTPVTLQDNQFVGGQFQVRGQTSGAEATVGTKAKVTGTDDNQNVFTIADGSTLTGLNVAGGKNGVYGGGDDDNDDADGDPGVSGFTISNNTIATSAESAIRLDGPNSGDISGNTLTSPGESGLRVFMFTGGEISGNTATSDDSADVGFFVDNLTGGRIGDNTAQGFDNGYVLRGVQNATITSNRAEANQEGFVIVGDGTSTISSNTATENTGIGFVFDGDIEASSITGNLATMNEEQGFLFAANSNGALILGNRAEENGEDGFRFQRQVVTGKISGNQAIGNNTNPGGGDGGFTFEQEFGGSAELSNNQASNDQLDGFVFQDGVSGGTIDGNEATENVNNGFTFGDDVTGGTISNNMATGNNTGGMGFGGFNFFNPSNGAAAPNVTINEDDGPTMITGNMATGDGRDGFAFGDVEAGTISGNIATGNNVDLGVNGGNGGFSFADVTGGAITQNESNGDNAFDGFFVTTFTGGNFDNNDANENEGMGYFFDSTPVAPATASANTGSDNTGGGDTFSFP